MKEIVSKPSILVVEDDEQLADLLLSYLEQHDFEVSHAHSGSLGAELILEKRPDIVILDLMLPGMNGLDICKMVRSSYAGAIVMLTASQSQIDHVTSLEMGADDFIVKPIEPRVLLARIRTQLRKLSGSSANGEQGGILAIGSLRIDTLTRDVTVEGRMVALTTMEFDVLQMLARQAGNIITREDMYSELMGRPYDGIDRGMDVHISRIRRKLQNCGFDPHNLKSVRGLGYLLAAR